MLDSSRLSHLIAGVAGITAVKRGRIFHDNQSKRLADPVNRYLVREAVMHTGVPRRSMMRLPAGVRSTGVALVCLLVLLLMPVNAVPAGVEPRPHSPVSEVFAAQAGGLPRLGLKHSRATDAPPAGLPRNYSLGRPLSASVDLSAEMPPVGDQGAQSSCAAWAAGYYYKSWSEKQEHTAWDLSNPWYQYSPSFIYNQINGGVDGGAYFDDAFSLLENTGDVDIAEMPYDDSDFTTQPTSSQKEAAKQYRIPATWGFLWSNYSDGPYSPPNDISGAKAWLDSGQPLVMGIPIYADFPDYYVGPSDYYDYDESSSFLGGHGVCICGYDDLANPGGLDEAHQGGFKVINSWGPGWNGGGFVYLSYDFVQRYVWEAWTMGDLTNDSPRITSLSESSGSAGDSVYIYGRNFGAERRDAHVTFNGTEATEVSFLNSRVAAKVPSGATTGPVVVYDWEGTASNSKTFTVGEHVVTPPPSVSSITPNTALQGTTVDITNLAGSNFQPGGGTTLVKLLKSEPGGGTGGGSTSISATGVSVVSSNKITCRFAVPSDAPTGAWNLYVRNPDGQAVTRSSAFTVTGLEVTYPTWYLAEGSSDWGFFTYISIENPNGTPVNARITYMTPSGEESGGTVSMPPASQATVNPADTIGVKDFSTKVVCLEGKTICVDRTMIWAGQGAAAAEAHSSVGVTAPAKTWYLPEGSSKWGFETWLLIQNPNGAEASCDITYMIEGEGPRTVTKAVPANARQSFNIAEDIGEKDASIKVEGSIPVIPERAMYRNNRREGHDSIGTTSPANDYYLAEGTTAYGFTTYVLIQNPNEQAAAVTVTYMTPSGPKPQASFSMEPNSRKTIWVNSVPGMESTDFSTRVHGSKPIIAERAMYWDNGMGEACHDSVGMAGAHTSFYFPDGQTSDGRETYTLVQNPNSTDVEVEIVYMTPDGTGNLTFTDSVPANSRKTFNMADKGIPAKAAVMVSSKSAGKKIMCERSMYWNERGSGTDTIGGYSD